MRVGDFDTRTSWSAASRGRPPVYMYGGDLCRKKTLGELNEESNCVVGTTENEVKGRRQ
jgi:hypothetical protein